MILSIVAEIYEIVQNEIMESKLFFVTYNNIKKYVTVTVASNNILKISDVIKSGK